jgi:hypothetical protein
MVPPPDTMYCTCTALPATADVDTVSRSSHSTWLAAGFTASSPSNEPIGSLTAKA